VTDAVLNPGRIRIGTAESHRPGETLEVDDRVSKMESRAKLVEGKPLLRLNATVRLHQGGKRSPVPEKGLQSGTASDPIARLPRSGRNPQQRTVEEQP
jgi:hypothetical protein